MKRPNRRAVPRVLGVAVSALLLAGTTAAGAGAGAPSASLAWAVPRTPVGRQLSWLTATFPARHVSVSALEAHLAPGLLAVLTPAAINRWLASLPAASSWPVLSLQAPVAGQLVATVADSWLPITIDVRVGPGGVVYGLFLTPAQTLPPARVVLSTVRRHLAGLAPQVGFDVATVGGGTCRPVASRAPATIRPLGPAASLFVLGAAATAADAGTLSWNQRLTNGLRSLPGGVLSTEPAGTTHTAAEVAQLMVSSEDATAADELTAQVGRTAVAVAAGDSADVPWLTTRELATLQSVDYPSSASRYVRDSSSGRLSYLRRVVDRVPLARLHAVSIPRMVDSLGWFASPAEVCDQLAALWADTNPATAAAVSSALALAGHQLQLPAGMWPDVWLARGDAPGVLALAALAAPRHGRVA
ncbi:MAG: serine hydrolase, partial [Acidimicrobiales bacterium]